MIPLKASHTRVSYGSMTGRGESLRVNSPKTMSRLVEGGGAGASLEGITFLRQPNFGRKDLHTYLHLHVDILICYIYHQINHIIR